jgi:hypothetical protein
MATHDNQPPAASPRTYRQISTVYIGLLLRWFTSITMDAANTQRRSVQPAGCLLLERACGVLFGPAAAMAVGAPGASEGMIV